MGLGVELLAISRPLLRNMTQGGGDVEAVALAWKVPRRERGRRVAESNASMAWCVVGDHGHVYGRLVDARRLGSPVFYLFLMQGSSWPTFTVAAPCARFMHLGMMST